MQLTQEGGEGRVSTHIIDGFAEIAGLNSLAFRRGPFRMTTQAPLPETTQDELPFKPLSAQEAQALRERHPSVSPWRVVAWQVVVGIVVAAVAWALTGQRNIAGSAGYGALAVVVPAIIFARGLTGRFSSLHAGTAAVGFMAWEMVKIIVSIALLAMAPKWVPALSWPALLIGLVVTMKVYWVALAFKPAPRPKV
jgi:ATP synthase protein I